MKNDPCYYIDRKLAYDIIYNRLVNEDLENVDLEVMLDALHEEKRFIVVHELNNLEVSESLKITNEQQFNQR